MRRILSQFVGFQIDGQQYAIRIEQIREIVILDQVTQTPQVASYVEGVNTLRGTIISIINLRKLLGLTPKPADSETRTIVVNDGDADLVQRTAHTLKGSANLFVAKQVADTTEAIKHTRGLWTCNRRTNCWPDWNLK